MKLREFDLDLPSADREERRDFGWQTRCVCSLYARGFDSSALGDRHCWKVLVQCVEKEGRDEAIDQLGVLCQEVSFALKKFQTADAYEQKVMALDVLHRGALRVAASKKWPKAPFEAARKAVIASGYVNEWTWPKPVSSPNRQWRAQVSCLHASDAFTASLVVMTKDGELVAKKQAFKESPSEFIFVPLLGSLKWTGARTVTLFAKNGKKVAALAVPAAARG